MAIKKSDLYSSLWASCDALRGGMDASQYKDYVLFMLFIKYVSDKYADSDDFAPAVVIPKGASFKDMIELKGKSDIGDKINTQIIQPLIDANSKLARSDFPDFNDPNKLGEGKEMVERLGNLIAIFQKPELDFSQNRADHDDILGDAYEFLMRHFAQDSGKSKGQFYTPSEVSRILAKVLGVGPSNTSAKTTAYDPTCGSGSLLLKVAAEAGKQITLEGQEKDVTTAGLARMNMILHDFPTANVLSGNTLTSPKFKDGEKLRTYDYVVANPPFSDKEWSTGLTLGDSGKGDLYQRFAWGVPPPKQGDYAYLMHIIRSMNSTGKAACILPHGVLFRGNAEGVIREKLVKSGILKGIIGLPANLFYGTGIPACVLVLDKQNASARVTGRLGVMMIDASKGFIKDGNKNKLREQDIHKIVDAFDKLEDLAGFARMVPLDEIASDKNAYNLNLPRYIDSTALEDIQDLQAHMTGGIPHRDLDALAAYWKVMPGLRNLLFKPLREGYAQLQQPMTEVKVAVLAHPEFVAFNAQATSSFAAWQARNLPAMQGIQQGDKPKALVTLLAEDLLATFKPVPLVDAYDVYQHLMDYWAAVMQDDVYLLVQDGWASARTLREVVQVKNKDNKLVWPETHDFVVNKRRFKSDLIPRALLIARYYAAEQAALDASQAELDAVSAQLAELEEENSAESNGTEGTFAGFEKINDREVKSRIKEIGNDADAAEELAVLKAWLKLSDEEATLKKTVKTLDAALEQKAYDRYATLTEADIQQLVVHDKWLATLNASLSAELDRVSQTLTRRIRELAERYATPLPVLADEVEALSAKVGEHLKKMGVTA
jgi:type I restriction enzyme M protein